MRFPLQPIADQAVLLPRLASMQSDALTVARASGTSAASRYAFAAGWNR
jgi:hypothetical protein